MSVDTYNRNLLMKIKSLAKTNPNAVAQKRKKERFTNYEILKMIKEISDQAKEPKEGVIDLATGIKY